MNERRRHPGRRQSELREQAEAALTRLPRLAARGSVAETLHELQVHQIELEMQNETLRQTETALEESRDRYLDLYEFAPVGYLTLDDSGTIVTANLTAAGLLGCERERLLARRFDACVGADGREPWQRLFLDMKAGAGARTLELELACGDGPRLFAQINCLRVAGTPGLRITIADIGERKRAELALRESEERFRSLFDHSMDAVFLTTPEGEILAANPMAQSLFGYSEEELRRIGRTAVVDPSDPRLRPALRQREETGRYQGELAFRDKSGRIFPVEVSSSLFLDRDGRRLTSMMVRDISQRLQAERELATLREDLHALLEWQVARHTIAALAHELHQPLSGIAALSTAASRMLASPRTPRLALREALGQLAADAQRAGGVARQLLASLRGPEVPMEAADLEPLLRQTARAAQDRCGPRCRLEIVCAAELPAVRINRLQVTKVLLNLIGNGVEAMGEQAWQRIRIDVAVDENGGSACVSVHDDGPGVAPGRERDIFHPFVSGKPGGLGMGLAISRSLVEMQGGRLWYDAAAGPGATFRFTLPFARPAP